MRNQTPVSISEPEPVVVRAGPLAVHRVAEAGTVLTRTDDTTVAVGTGIGATPILAFPEALWVAEVEAVFAGAGINREGRFEMTGTSENSRDLRLTPVLEAVIQLIRPGRINPSR